MPHTTSNNVPRPQEDPPPEEVRNALNPCEPYTAKEIASLFDDVSRWTIQRRLETLQERDQINRKKHSENRVSWWIEKEED